MHGLGNDFMVVDAISQRFEVSPQDLARLADRRTGVGFDQLLLVEAPTERGNAFKYRIFNADGSEVNQCGNGARCFARFVMDHELTDLEAFWVETNAGRLKLSILDDGQIKVNMGVPRFEPAVIPMAEERRRERYSLEFDGQTWSFVALEIGNPHAVFKVDSVADAPVEALGEYLQSHPLFPERVNAGFYELVSDQEIRLRVFERGVGETLACGSGACAAVVAGIGEGLLQETVGVHLAGGELQVEYAGEGKPVCLLGTATTVYTGKLHHDFLTAD